MYKNDPRLITARFASTCPETGRAISKGDEIAYYPRTKSAYHSTSKADDEVRGMQFASSFDMADANW